MSYRVEVIADGSNKWTGNALRFASLDEAGDYGKDLASRWTSVRRWRAVESDDPVTHRVVGQHVWPIVDTINQEHDHDHQA
jgi:hypothetical protein